jgi:hypothetical protein
MGFNYKKVVLRALNSYDQISPITGLGIKCIMDQMQNQTNDKLLSAILKRKLEVSTSLIVREFKTLKEIIDGNYKYRSMISPSPFSALMEAFCFYELSTTNKLNVQNSVYSYRMPHQGKKSPRNFEYYYKNYIDMNYKISDCLQKSKGDAVVIIDLKSFYKSIDTNIALEGLEDALPYKLIKGTFLKFKSGLPIGLDLSHVVAQNFLSNFDIEMQKLYGKKYFRYVDDISIVCHAKDKDTVVSNVKRFLPVGVSVNDEKYDVVAKLDWIAHTKQFEERKTLDNFSTMIHLYFMFNSDMDVESVQKKLLEYGYSVPLEKVKKRVETKTFRSYSEILLKERFSMVSSIFRWSENQFFNFLLNRKIYHLNSVNTSIEEMHIFEDSKDIKARFSIQNIKFHLSNLFYLLNDSELISLNERLPKNDALAYFEDIICALTEHKFDRLLIRGGRGPIVLCELWQARCMPVIKITLNNIPELKHSVEALVYLKLMEVIDFDLEIIKSRLDKDDYDYVLSILGGDINYDEASPYVKELHGIFSMYDQQELKSLLMTKFDKEEFSDFSAFDNGLY